MAYEKDPDEIGALWVKSSAKGEYMTGEVNGVKVVCFRTKSSHERAPQWRVMKSKPREDGPSVAPINESDIPF